MTNTTNLRPSAPPLPATVQDLDAMRKLKKPLISLNDIVEEINRKLWDDPDYQRYLSAIWPDETIEGSFVHDDTRAVMMIQKYANEHGIIIPPTSNKLSPLVKSLHVVLGRRHGLSRQERRNMVQGKAANGGTHDEHNDGFGE